MREKVYIGHEIIGSMRKYYVFRDKEAIKEHLHKDTKWFKEHLKNGVKNAYCEINKEKVRDFFESKDSYTESLCLNFGVTRKFMIKPVYIKEKTTK